MGVSAILVSSSDAETPGARPRPKFVFVCVLFFGLVPIFPLQGIPVVFVVVLGLVVWVMFYVLVWVLVWVLV